MDALCLKAGIHGIDSDLRLSEKPSRNFSWGFTLRRPLWPGTKSRLEPAIAGDDAVSAEIGDENWVSKLLRFNSLRKREEELNNRNCDMCVIEDDKTEFDRESFSKLLRKVSLAESRLYAQLSYLGSLAYCIPQIKVYYTFLF